MSWPGRVPQLKIGSLGRHQRVARLVVVQWQAVYWLSIKILEIVGAKTTIQMKERFNHTHAPTVKAVLLPRP
jgi:hypothetical protein